MKRLFLLASLTITLAVGAEGIRPGDTIVFCGDSITCLGKFKPWGYRFQITNALARVRGCTNVTCVNLGFCGNGLRNWLSIESNSRTRCVQANDHARAYPEESVSSTFSNRVDILVLSLGMNDMLCPLVPDTPEALASWTNDYRRLVRTLRARLNPRRFVVCTIQPLTNDPESAKNKVEAILDDGIRAIAAAEKVTLADYHEALMANLERIRTRSTRYQDTPDFVHPQELGNIAMAAELTRALGDDDLSRYLLAQREKRLAELVPLDKAALAYRVFPTTPDDIRSKTRTYTVTWTRLADGKQGTSQISLQPEQARTRVKVAEGEVVIPAPWRVSNPLPHGASITNVTAWKIYSPTCDYLGWDSPNSIDYMQAWYGTQNDTFFAVRRVWSEKARPVVYRLSTAAFSNTYAFTVYQDGAAVGTHTLPRGKTAAATAGLFNLKKGWNEIAVKCEHNQWQRQFSLEMIPVSGDTLDALRYDATLEK